LLIFSFTDHLGIVRYFHIGFDLRSSQELKR
jgi:hypothetical protein